MTDSKKIADMMSADGGLSKAVLDAQRSMKMMSADGGLSKALLEAQRSMKLMSTDCGLSKALLDAQRSMKIMSADGGLSKALLEAQRSMKLMSADDALSKALLDAQRSMKLMSADDALSKALLDAQRSMKLMYSDGGLSKALLEAQRSMKLMYSDGGLSKALLEAQRSMKMMYSNGGLSKTLLELDCSLKMLYSSNEIVTATQKKGPSNHLLEVGEDRQVDVSLGENSEDIRFVVITKQIEELKRILKIEFEEIHSKHEIQQKKVNRFFIIIWFVSQILLPQINSLVANLYTPYVQSYLVEKKLLSCQKRQKDSEIIRDLKKVSSIRYVAANALNVRQASRKNSDIVSTLPEGTLVRVLNKRKNWLKIEAQIDEQIIQGWAFTRYLKKLK